MGTSGKGISQLETSDKDMVRDFSQSSLLKKEVYFNSQEKVKSIIKEEIATEEDAKNQSRENYMK